MRLRCLSAGLFPPVRGGGRAAAGPRVTAMRSRAGYLRRGIVAAVVAAALCPALPGGASAAAADARALASGGVWGTAREVPGTAALNTGGQAQITAVSCASAGNCSAGGQYAGGSGQQVFVVSRHNGRWGKAEQVPGIAALNTGGQAQITSLSCASPGNCSAGGLYSTFGSGNFPPLQAFVVSQHNGRWGNAEQVPGTAALNAGGRAQVTSVSCASPGNCSVGGNYTDRLGREQAFVVSQTNGAWGKAKKVPGLAVLGTIGHLNSVSCASAGNCSAGGYYIHPAGHEQAFAVSQRRGAWGTAVKIPGMSSISSLSCASAGNCSAGGSYFSAHFHAQGFVVSQDNGSWGKAKQVPGLAALSAGGSAFVLSVSCASAGNCSAGGFYATPHGHAQAFVVNQNTRTWGNAQKVPGTAALNAGRNAATNTVSCAPAGTCSAGGYYTDRSHHQQAFVVSQTS